MEKVLIEKLEKFGLESLQGNDVHGFIVEKLGIKELFEKFDQVREEVEKDDESRDYADEFAQACRSVTGVFGDILIKYSGQDLSPEEGLKWIRAS